MSEKISYKIKACFLWQPSLLLADTKLYNSIPGVGDMDLAGFT